MANPGLCSIDGCGKSAQKRGWCISHYVRWQRHGDPLGGRTPEGEPLRFIREVAMTHTGDGCLTWPYAKVGKGYGKTKVNGKYVVVSRYICELVHGAPPTPNHEAAHSCGKGHEGCIAPGHLDWKTPTENNADKIIHGTNNGRRPLMSEAFAIHAIGFFLAAVMLLSPVSSFAGKNDPTWDPPSQFEQTFPDQLTIHKVEPKDVAQTCKDMWKRTGYKFAALPDHGCSVTKDGVCEVVIPSRPIEGATPIAILRHEIGHCNGWADTHPD